MVESYSATSHRIPCSLSNVFVSSLVWWVDLGRYYEYLILHRAYVDFMLSYPSLFVHLSFRIYGIYENGMVYNIPFHSHLEIYLPTCIWMLMWWWHAWSRVPSIDDLTCSLLGIKVKPIEISFIRRQTRKIGIVLSWPSRSWDLLHNGVLKLGRSD